uniref:Metalloendopeptidase n=1 Tax=Angiostrongylus cantonensis TaxID=6313 RepID=A0A0K0DHB2_ANGCA
MIAILALLTTLAGATVLSSTDSRTKRSIPDGEFEARLQTANSLLRSERDADNTMELIRKLHSMEDEIREELEMTPEEKADLEKKMKNYGHIRRDHVRKMGDSIAEINRNSGVDLALFQGDMILTEQQAADVLADIEENTGHRTKRQAFRDKTYPNNTWTNGVNYYFYNSSSAAVRVFRKAAALWATETCVNFGETYAGKAKATLSIGETVLQYGWESQFTKQTEQTNYNYNITYDYGTIMHYGATSASANGQPFMFPHDITFLQTLGSPFISFYEKLMMNLHYKCLGRHISTEAFHFQFCLSCLLRANHFR